MELRVCIWRNAGFTGSVGACGAKPLSSDVKPPECLATATVLLQVQFKKKHIQHLHNHF